MNRLSPLAAVAAALVCLTASADRPEYAWGKTFEVEELADMVLDGDGNLYVALNEFIDLTPEQNGLNLRLLPNYSQGLSQYRRQVPF